MATDVAREPADDALATAIGQYVLGERSLGNAAETVGMSRWEFESLLKDTGFSAIYGPRSKQELDDEIEVARRLNE